MLSTTIYILYYKATDDEESRLSTSSWKSARARERHGVLLLTLQVAAPIALIVAGPKAESGKWILCAGSELRYDCPAGCALTTKLAGRCYEAARRTHDLVKSAFFHVLLQRPALLRKPVHSRFISLYSLRLPFTSLVALAAR